MSILAESIAGLVEKIEIRSRSLVATRQELLAEAALQIAVLIRKTGQANMLFVCTHNSRRSQLSEMWARVASVYYDVGSLKCFSCGTEATECNMRTIAALRRAGFDITSNGALSNPVYRCSIAEDEYVDLFSKAFGHSAPPSQAIVAMMCCDDADQRCPVIQGAEFRVPLHYRDPKESDGTQHENSTYDERSEQIAAEMLFLVRTIRESPTLE